MTGGNEGNSSLVDSMLGNVKGNHRLFQNAVQESPGVQNVRNQNGVIVVPGIAHQNGNGNVVAAWAEGNANGNNGNHIRCYNCRGLGHLARNCIVRTKVRNGMQLSQNQSAYYSKGRSMNPTERMKEFELEWRCQTDLIDCRKVNANCILMANLQQASTLGTQTDKAPAYDSDVSAEVQLHDNCYNDEIFNMFTQEEQYTKLLESIPEPHQVPQNDSNVVSEVSIVEQATEVEKVNSVNRKLRETNANLTTELARYKNQERCFEISQEKYDKLERCYQQSVYQEQCLSKKINALHLSSEKSTVSSLQEEKKRLESDFKIRKDELLDKKIDLENKIKDLDNTLVKTGQSISKLCTSST
ncbi:retrovirus-related pol polyprotein from transposon TNT 1-94 [Tanacetum coccineum]